MPHPFKQPEDKDRSGGPSAMQFRLRTLLFLMAALSALFAFMVWLGALGSLIFGLIIVFAVAHVAGNAIGTRLKSQHPRRQPPERPMPTPQGSPMPPRAAGEPPRLGDKASLGRPTKAMTLAGTAVGALAGRLLFLQLDQTSLSAADWTLAITSFAIVGGMLGFLASSFFQVGFWPAVICFFNRAGGNTHLEARLGDVRD